MLNVAQFRAHLAIEVDRSSMAGVGRSLGVSGEAVRRWMDGGRNPSRMALVLATIIWSGPQELSSGLPGSPLAAATGQDEATPPSSAHGECGGAARAIFGDKQQL